MRCYVAGAACVLSVMLLGGCATTSPKHQAYLQELRTRNVKPEVYDKAEHLQPLALDDIEHMVTQGVPEDDILYHLKRSRAMYQLTTAAVDRLRKVGASENLINYLLSTPLRYRAFYGPYYSFGPYYYWAYPYPYGFYYYGPPFYPVYPPYYRHGSGLHYHRLR